LLHTAQALPYVLCMQTASQCRSPNSFLVSSRCAHNVLLRHVWSIRAISLGVNPQSMRSTNEVHEGSCSNGAIKTFRRSRGRCWPQDPKPDRTGSSTTQSLHTRLCQGHPNRLKDGRGLRKGLCSFRSRATKRMCLGRSNPLSIHYFWTD